MKNIIMIPLILFCITATSNIIGADNSSFPNLYNILGDLAPTNNNNKIIGELNTYTDDLQKLRNYNVHLHDIEDFKSPFKDSDSDKKSLLRAKYAGSGWYMSCQKESHKRWPKVAGKQQTSAILENKFKSGFKTFAKTKVEEINVAIKVVNEQKKDWTKYFDKLKDDVANCTDDGSTESCISESLEKVKEVSSYLDDQIVSLGQRIWDYYKETNFQLSKVQMCMGLAAMTHYVDYDKSDIGTPKSVKTFDGKIECYSDGAETQDYKACSRAVMAYNAAAIGQKGLETVQGILVQNNLMEKQMELMSQSATSSIDITKRSFEAQKTGIEEQEKVSQQRVAFHGAKLAAMLTIHQTFPTPSDMVKTCSESGIKGDVGLPMQKAIKDSIINYIDEKLMSRSSRGDRFDSLENKLATLIRDIDKADKEQLKRIENQTPQDICQYVIDSGKFSLTKNQAVKDVLKQVMMTAGIDMASDGVTANILGKQADRLDKAIAGIDGFKPEDLPGLEPEAILRRFCEQYPQDPKCQGFNTPYQGIDWGDGGFSFNGGSGQATQIGTPETDKQDDLASGKSTSKTSSGKVFMPSTPVDKQSGFIDPPVVAGALKTINPPSAAGGGSLGGGGGSLGSSGGAQGARSARKKPASKFKMPKYSKSGSFKYLSGKGVQNRTASNNKNPLADFFKKKQRNISGKRLNFGKRGIASKKSSSIWKIISKGYAKANNNKRLLSIDAIKNSIDTDF